MYLKSMWYFVKVVLAYPTNKARRLQETKVVSELEDLLTPESGLTLNKVRRYLQVFFDLFQLVSQFSECINDQT